LIYHNEIIDSNNIFCDTLFFDNVEVDDVTKHAINRLIFNTKCKKLIFHNFISNFTGNLYIDYKILIKQGYYCTPDENIRNLVPIKLIDIEANKLQNQEKKLYNSFEGFVKQNKF
jgi:hypothetical protein